MSDKQKCFQAEELEAIDDLVSGRTPQPKQPDPRDIGLRRLATMRLERWAAHNIEGPCACNDCNAVVVDEITRLRARLRTEAAPPEPETKSTGLEAVTAEYLAWADETFPEATPASCVEHLRREVKELQQRPSEPEELADAAMLVFHAAHKAGVDLVAALQSKLETNRAREWGELDEHGVREHVRGVAPEPEPQEKAREAVARGGIAPTDNNGYGALVYAPREVVWSRDEAVAMSQRIIALLREPTP